MHLKSKWTLFSITELVMSKYGSYGMPEEKKKSTVHMVVVVHFVLEHEFQPEFSIFPHLHVRFLSMLFDMTKLYTNKSTSIELKTVSDSLNFF
jgi:hypothetical protein